MNRPAQLESRLPCAVLRLWWLDRHGEARFPDSRPDRILARPEGVHEVGEGCYAVVPWAGDPAVFDAATDWARQLELESGSASKSSESRLAPLAVIYPGVVSIGSERAQLEPDDLDFDLDHRPPKLPAGVYLSGRAAKMLEYIPALGKGVSYQGQSGKALPLIRFEGPQYDQPPWRNPEVLGHRTEYVIRKQLSDRLFQLLGETVTRVTGSLGCGKTRMVWQEVMRQNGMRLWIRARPPRIEAPIVSEQLITQLLIPSEEQLRDPLHPRFDTELDSAQIREALAKRGGRRSEAEIRLLSERATVALSHLAQRAKRKVWIVIDDFHQISSQDFAFFKHLLEAVDLTVFRFVLIGRNGGAWPDSLEPLPILEIPPLEDHEMEELAAKVTTGLSIPEVVEKRFLNATRGYPFAFEEGLFALVHERYLRRIYGSFFFGGNDDLEYQPSSRLVRHVEAEVSRLGEPLPLRLLSITEHPVPAAELASAASILGKSVEPGWEEPFIEARILDNVESAWGRGVRIVSPVNRRALSHSLPQERALEARRALGELLSFGGSDGESHWLSYRLLSGLPEAIEPLMRLFKTRHVKEIPRDELLGALERELRGLRDRAKADRGEVRQAPRQEGDDIELELLWRMLPLARRMGRLNKYESDLARGVELSAHEPRKLLGLASIKAEQDQESGRFQDAENTIQFALKAAGGLEARHKALLLMQLGRLFLRQSRFDEAEQLFSNLLKALDETEAAALTASCRFYLGNVALHRRDLDAAHSFHLAALEQRQQHKLNRAAGASLSALGAVATAQGNYPQALEYYRQSLTVLERHGKEGDDSFAFLGLARAYGRIGDFHAATKPARRALELRSDRDDVAGEAIARLAVAMNYLDLGKSDAALTEARKAHFQLTMSSADEQLADTELTLGVIHLRQGRDSDARRRFEEALRRFRELNKRLETSFVLAYLIEVSVMQEDAEAIRTFTAELKNKLNELPPPDQGEILDFRIYRGLEWLSNNGFKVGNPASFLARAYKSVMKKAENLSQELRQRYLFRIPANQEIVDSATRRGLTATD
ncbi:MAG: tetratricopeptide repeat protein [bacterium]|nr:tetratricopeptide repeat protein [bacterium]